MQKIIVPVLFVSTEPLPGVDIVMAGGKILSLPKRGDTDGLIAALKAAGVVVNVVDATSCVVTPGFVDAHVGNNLLRSFAFSAFCARTSHDEPICNSVSTGARGGRRR
jgi:dihydroorotase-like cyclic amidohydrolase